MRIYGRWAFRPPHLLHHSPFPMRLDAQPKVNSCSEGATATPFVAESCFDWEKRRPAASLQKGIIPLFSKRRDAASPSQQSHFNAIYQPLHQRRGRALFSDAVENTRFDAPRKKLSTASQLATRRLECSRLPRRFASAFVCKPSVVRCEEGR